MKISGRSIFVLLGLSLIVVTPIRGELLLWQDFNTAPSVASLVDTTSSDTSRFYGIDAYPADADDFPGLPGGIVEEQRLNGVGTTALTGGKLRFSLRAAWRTYYTEGQSPDTRQRNSLTSTGAIVRLFPPGSRPDRLFWRFKLKSTAANLPGSSSFLEGVSQAQVFAGKTIFSLGVDGGNRFVVGVGGSDLIFEDEVEITILINKTAAALEYNGPDGIPTSVGTSAFDAWINDTLIVNEGPHLPATPISNVQVSFTGRIGAAVENLGGDVFGIPQFPGPPFEFEVDDILMRSDFDQIVPAGAASMSLSGSLNFGRKTTGSRSRKTFLIRNTGTAPMHVSQVLFPGPVFKGSFSGPIPAGGSGAVSVTFLPKKVKSYRGLVVVRSDAPNSPRSLPISGTGRKK